MNEKSDDKILIRKLNEKDNAEEVIDIIHNLFLEKQNNSGIPEDLSDREVCKEVVEDLEDNCFVAIDEENGKIIGTNFYADEGL